jgi:ribosomal protein S18 acetylase RimI-like enzyme
VRYSPSLAEETTAAYNRAVANVPCCYPMSPGEFQRAVTSSTASFGRNIVRDSVTHVARSEGRIVGWATSAIGTHGSDGLGERAIVRMLYYERGESPAGQALLEAVEERLLGPQFAALAAFAGTFRLPGYHLPYAGLTDRWDHVRALLGMNGYTCRRGEVFLDWPDCEPPDPGSCPMDLEVRVERRPGEVRNPDIEVRALRDQGVIGTCRCLSAATFSRADPAQSRIFTRWIGIHDRYQGQGLGRHLLLLALREARAAGYAHATISSEASNYRAMLLYGNLGYRAVDWTTRYVKGADNGYS